MRKQGVDLHTSTFGQALAAEYLDGGYLNRQLPRIISLYAPRLAAMLDAMDEHFPSSFAYSRPEGGMFVWAEGPPGVDTEKLYYEAVKRNVAFVPGKFFYPHPKEGLATMRLNFTMNDEASIRKGIAILAKVLREAA